MMQFEKPDGPEDFLARITVALLITAVVGAVIVGGIMWLLLDAPSWSLAAAVAIIFAGTLALAFSPMDEEEEPPPAKEPRKKFGLSGPRGKYGRWGQLGGFLSAIWGLNALSYVFFDLIWTAPLWVRPSFFVFSVILAFLMEYTTLGDFLEDEDGEVVEAQSARSSGAPETFA